MAGRRINGGIIGAINDSNPGRASGVWGQSEQFIIRKGNKWPITVFARGLTVDNPATSAKDVYDTSGASATDGNYYINNIYTGDTTREVYCRFNKDGEKHFQRWTPSHFTTYGGPRTYGGSTGVTVGSTVNNDNSTTNTGTFYGTGTSTGSGASAMVDTGLQLSNFQGHTWIQYVYTANNGDGFQQLKYVMLDFGASSGTGNGDYGSSYVPDYYWARGGTDGYTPATTGSSALAKVTFAASGGNTLVGPGRVIGGTDYATMWSEASDFTTNGAQGDSQAQQTRASTLYVGIRFGGWTGTGSAGSYYTSFWAHID